MSDSPLVSYRRISPNRTSPRRNGIDRVTIHMTVGQIDVVSLGEIFANPNRQASSNYGIGPDGRIAQYVEERDRSWCSSSAANDNRAVTIETASDKTSPYAVTNSAYAALLDLVTDICRRNGKSKLLWLGEKDRMLAYKPAPDEMVLTLHRWFAATECPGEYLLERQSEIAQIVTERLEEMNYEDFKKCMARYEAEQKNLPADSWAVDSLDWAVENGIMEGDGHGNLMPMANVTREQFATMLHRYADKLTGKA